MNVKFESTLDQIGIEILFELQKNARTSFSKIGRRVGISSPAVLERIHKMEEIGIIRGYHVEIDREKVDSPILAFIYLTTQTEEYQNFYTFARNAAEVVECHCTSGSESFILRVVASSVSHLDRLVENLSTFGETKTSIVLSSPVVKSTIKI